VAESLELKNFPQTEMKTKNWGNLKQTETIIKADTVDPKSLDG